MTVAVADDDLAHALRPALEALAWRVFPAVLQRQFDRLAPAGLHVLIERLDLDLGRLRPAFLETDAVAALELALEEAIAAALHAAGQNDPMAAQLLDPAVWRRQRLATYLESGSLPDRRARPMFVLADEIASAAAEDPSALIAMLRGLSRRGRALDRLVLTLGDAGLSRLLALLAPADAATIMGLIGDTLRLHRVEPPPALQRLAPPALRRLLWATTFDFLLHDAGTAFNRRRFLEALLRRAAVGFGVTLPALLALLARALRLVTAQSPLRSSLPRTLAELLEEHADALPAQPWAGSEAVDAMPVSQAGGMAAGHRQGTEPQPSTIDAATLAQQLADLGDRASLAGLIARPGVKQLLPVAVRRMSQPAFDAVLARIVPTAAGDIGRGLAALAAALTDSAMTLPPPPEGWLGRLRSAALGVLATSASGPIDLADVWQRLLVALSAGRADLAPALLVKDVRMPRSLRSALVAAATASGTSAAAGVRTRLARLVRAGDAAGAMAALGQLSPTALPGLLTPALRALLVDHLADADFARLLAQLDEGSDRPAARGLGATSQTLRPADLDQRDARRRQLDAALAVHAGLSVGTWPGEPGADGPPVADRRRTAAAEHGDRDADDSFGAAHVEAAQRARLRAALAGNGQTPDVHLLAALAITEPDWLMAAARQAAERAGASAVAGQLVAGLMPDELLDMLPPSMAARLRKQALAAGGNARWWQQAVAAALAGKPLPPAARTPSLARRADELAALAAWLGGGAPPASASARWRALSLAEQMWLVSADDAEAVLARLGQLTAHLAPAEVERLIQKLVPWMVAPRGPIATLLAGRDPAAAQAIRLRAAAAALSGDRLDLAALAAVEPDQVNQPVGAALAAAAAEGAAAKRAVRRQADQVDRAPLFSWLAGAAAASDPAAMARLLIQLLDRGDPDLVGWLRARRGRARDRARWAAIPPEPALVRVLQLLSPAAAPALQDGLMLLAVTARQVLPFGVPRPDPRRLWQTLLDAVATAARVDVPRVLADLVETVAGGDQDRAARVRARALKLADESGHAGAAAALRRAPPKSPPAAPVPASPARPAQPDRAATAAADEPRDERPYFLGNAGLVIVNPYLPTLFERLGLLAVDETGRQKIQSEEAASRACHLLQYLVDGRLDAPEPELVLNKLLCGLPTIVPVAPALVPEAGDLAMCDGLLAAVIAAWPPLANTSITGLQETFLQREGRLRRSNGQWALQVQRRALDVLMAQLPWGVSTIVNRWMPEPIHVTW